ncbi:MAG: FAD-dependent monooxygenase [Chitinophagaceae bacterium]|nr:FAD-dependent monooxygenase [Chitinophagaceae bacterium]MCB9047727.1 FAD-dependent monooxygenase [Chitinophagales bacterium]
MARRVTILGAGLVGSLLAIIFRKRGHEVTVYERRPDMRLNTMSAGKSINLAMSERGWRALDLAGLRKDIADIAIPMYGRYLHQADGSSAFQQYGTNNEAIYSVSRGELNRKLMTLAEEHGVTIHFNQRCTKVDVQENKLHMEQEDGSTNVIEADLLFGADGAFSALRNSYIHMDRVDARHFYLKHGYKELSIPPLEEGGLQIEENGLHIWPRKNFMMIALPNTDGNFTCTLFMPFEGKDSFEQLQTEADVKAFFNEHFPDAVPKMPTLIEDFFTNPTASLITTFIEPWHYKDKSALIGDAAHAIVPFYGQGMNAGFEDCTILAGLMDKYKDDWTTILQQYDTMRKPNGDAVAELALKNFIEMRDKVADAAFLERKKIEKELVRRYPEQFISVYEMVSFSHIPYSTAKSCIEAQDNLLGKIMDKGDFFNNINNEQFLQQLDKWVADYHQSVQQLDFGHKDD